MRSGAILSEVYPVRIRAVKALLAAEDRRVANAAELRQGAVELEKLTSGYADPKIAMVYAAFADLLRVAAMLIDWRAAVLNAAPESARFLASARERYLQWRDKFAEREGIATLAQAASRIETIDQIQDVSGLSKLIGSIPLPVGVFADDPYRRRRIPPVAGTEDKEEEALPAELAVAFIRFTIDTTPAGQTEFMTPREAHDLEIEVRVSRWPDRAEALRLSPVTIEAPDTYSFPEFSFTRPSGDPPYLLSRRGRATLHVSQALRAQPFEFRYAATFDPYGVEQPIAVVGQRTLLIESVDVRRSPITGYEGIDRRIIALRKELWAHPHVAGEDLENALVVLSALANLAGQAVQDNCFSEPIDEAAFQKFVRADLRRRPEIGSRLEEHPRAAGGATDLSFERIRIELKSQNDQPLRLPDCQQFVGQTSSYTVGSDKRVGILCVLDGSTKREAAFAAEDGIGVLTTEDGAVAVITVLIQGNLPRPSDLSRRGMKSRKRPMRQVG
jgi:hypothetical protein